ncbi:MAG: hypothetical protein ACFFBP_14295 [Promethearchaeota archaeon]
MEGNLIINHPQEDSSLRELNKRFDRRLIISFLNSNMKNYSKNKNNDFYEILVNLIEKKLVHIHCSNVNKENLSLLNKKQYKTLLNSRKSIFLESKDNLLFISL